MRVIRVSTVASSRPKLDGLARNRPRTFAEWKALRRWGKLPIWERGIVGYRLRALREAAGLTQKSLAARLGVTQQAVAQAERWESNPTVDLLRRWAAACDATLEIRLDQRTATPTPAPTA
jgi:DNA-binding XRE family transcriptional regulator